MALADIDWLLVALRTAVYVGTIASAGSILVRATLKTETVIKTLNWQIRVGLILLLIVEPARYVNFQLNIANGDWLIAFDPAMRWMGMETPLGQAASVRLLGAAIVTAGFRWKTIPVIGAILMIGSYLLEGHTVTSESRIVLALVLFVHLSIAHWWLGALVPLRASLLSLDQPMATRMIDEFGRIAPWLVAILFVAGGAILLVLTNGIVNPTLAYQQGFAIKLLAFSAIILIAAVNKLWWTRLLINEPEKARRGLMASINLELAVGTAILAATAVATSFPPQD
jgi:putative copper resistance protein D